MTGEIGSGGRGAHVERRRLAAHLARGANYLDRDFDACAFGVNVGVTFTGVFVDGCFDLGRAGEDETVSIGHIGKSG